MKSNYLSAIIFLLILTSNLFCQDFYDINTINTLELTFTESNWDYLLDNLVSEGNEERLLGTAVINGFTYDSVGIRYKGNSTYRAEQVKNPLNIKLDYIFDGQEHEGYDKLKLANVYKDPSFVREALSYEIAREYIPASLANYIKVSINGTYIGLYTSVQDVDKFFMRTNFYSDDNARIKGEINSSIGAPTGSVWEYFDNDSSSYYGSYSLESDFGWQELIWFLDTLNNNNEHVEKVLNVDRHLWFLAFSNLFVNLDGPINNPQNYYLYKDDAGRFNPIPWDLNESFGVFTSHQTLGQLGTFQLQQLSPFANINESQFPIISKILSNDSYRKMYVAHMKTIISDYFDNDLYRTRAFEIQDIIDTDVQADPNKFYTYDNFTNNVDYSVGGEGPPGPNSRSIIGITELMDARVTYLNSHSDFQATSPTISELCQSPSPSPYSDVWITANVSDANSVQLAYRSRLTDAFENIEMLDDGNNEDGAVADGVYGVSVSTGSSGFQYYIYAENDEAASFSPERAATKFYTLTVSNNLVINEFMAINQTTAADSDGEFEDWIELYNNSDEDIALNGYYLSDDADDLSKWTFPDTVISAKGYLIVWADNDVDQQGLHANFKISGSGETIYLLDSDTTLIGEVSYTAQTTDFSTGRYPNGTGSFVQMTSTFDAENIEGITSVEDPQLELPSSYSLEQNFPNPFNPSTQIVVSIPESGMHTLRVYNVLGQEVATLLNNQITAGTHTFNFDASNLSSGIYFYNFSGNNFTQTKKMMLMK
jgi:spore coat protein CotH